MNAPTARQFVLRRDHDVTGVSGPGDVADGVQWPDGSVVLRWRERPSTSVWDSLDLMLSVHGHDGATRVVWLSEDTIPVADHLEAACRAQQEIERLRGAAGRAYLLADRWEAAHGSAGFLVRAAGAELRDVLDEDARTGCENTSHGAHVGFTCAEVDESKPYWNVRWAQEHTAASREPGPDHDDWRRRAEQAEDLLRVAHETSNRAEAERASAVRRVEQADAVTARTKELLDRRTTTLRQRAERAEAERDGAVTERERMRDLLIAENKRANDAIDREHAAEQAAEEAQATIERVRALHTLWKLSEASPNTYCGHCEKDGRPVRWPCATNAALDGTEQPADSRACRHCPDGHQAPTGGSQPWGVWVGPERDGDGQPTTIHVARSAGAHVAESDAEWMRHMLNHLPASETYCTLPHEMEA